MESLPCQHSNPEFPSLAGHFDMSRLEEELARIVWNPEFVFKEPRWSDSMAVCGVAAAALISVNNLAMVLEAGATTTMPRQRKV